MLVNPDETQAVVERDIADLLASGRFADFADDPDRPTADIPAALAPDRFAFDRHGEREAVGRGVYARAPGVAG